jgi:hypothetical protein
MKKIITCIFAFIAINSAFAQGHFELGSNVIGVGIGLGSSYGISGYGSTESPAINLQYENGTWDIGGPGILSLGGYVAYKSYSYDYLGYSWNSHYTIIGVRSAYHYNGIKSDKFDVYAGLMLGYRTISYSDNNYLGSASASDIILSAFIGGRYYFNENFAGFVELGNGISIMNLGLAYKF